MESRASTGPHQGLSESVAQERLRQVGRNELPPPVRHGVLGRLLHLIGEPMLLLLVGISALYLFMGDTTEGIALGLSALFVIALTYYQDAKSENALEALRDLSSPRALVVRGAAEKRIPASELVPGDLVVLHEGDRIPADAFLVFSSHLRVDESLLTGEAFPVSKEVLPVDEGTDPHSLADAGKVFMGTLVVGGKAFARVHHTGARTEMGKIGTSLAGTGAADSSMAREVARMVRAFAWIGGVLCVAIVLLYGGLRHDWTGALLAGLATAMSLLPEEFPVVLSIFLALGAWRLSRVNVLVRRPSATERLGAVTDLCVDKTGTITLNRMTLALVQAAGEPERRPGLGGPLPPGARGLLSAGLFASHPHPFDPMEKAIASAAALCGLEGPTAAPLREFPLTRDLLATTFAWPAPGGGVWLATKGAPEAVLHLCGESAPSERELAAALARLAGQGFRILAVAEARVTSVPDSPVQMPLRWLGLLAFEDPVREEVPAAVAACRRAGVQVRMITGDYPETARHVAIAAGLGPELRVLTGAQVEVLGDEELRRELTGAQVFARMRPEQKLRIVNALQAQGAVVAMTGDGVNDAPSLKQADIGIAMGARGTDVAREAADLVLVDDNFASIVAGIERGRSIYANLRKSIRYIISIHVPLAGLAFFPVLLGWPLVLLPIHIALLEILIDPACSLLFEAHEPEEEAMSRPPRPAGAPLLTGRALLRCTLEGLLVLGPALFLYATELRAHASEEHARAVAFLFLSLGNVGLILADLTGGRPAQLRKLAHQPWNLGLLAGVTALLFALVEVPFLAHVFRFSVLPIDDLLKACLLGLGFFAVACAWNASAGEG